MADFINFWQHIPEHIRPYIFQIGSFQLRYYGLMYIAGFATVYMLCLYRLRREHFEYSRVEIENFFMWAIVGLMIGARLGYVIFYNLPYYIAHPLEIFLPFSVEGGFRFTGLAGMSYHGGLIGVLVATFMYCRKNGIKFLRFVDFIIPAIPMGYTFGRIGNFINGELYGRPTSLSIGMYFPLDPTGMLRHPSQLYEAFFEGIFLFIILWNLRRIRSFDGFFLACYITGYGMVRFFIEFVREPDPQIGLFLGFISLGQILCLAMIVAGAAFLSYGFRKEAS
jgi:phosphatidylglycerol:prolipoprotein diacylglycerol transferase